MNCNGGSALPSIRRNPECGKPDDLNSRPSGRSFSGSRTKRVKKMMKFGFCHARHLLVALIFLPAPSLNAHEYWISVDDYIVEPGDLVSARLMVGQMMEGNELPRLSRQIKSFEYYAPDDPQEATGREGDRPAFSYEAAQPGLHIIAKETLPLEVTFETFEEYRDYLDYEGLERFAAIHLERGLPRSEISEAYTRFTKALVQVGSVKPGDRDRVLGHAYELVALENPYAAQDILPVELLWQGQPEPNTQISVFRKQHGNVERMLISTDNRGRADIPLDKAGGQYLLNTVHLEELSGDGPFWRSSWASMTFALSGQ